MAQPHEWIFSTAQLANKRVLITGGSTGIGLETARMLAYFGAKLFLIARDKSDLKEAEKAIKEVNKDTEVHILSMDITKPADITRLFTQIDKKWDGLDILINNAALGYGSVLDGDFEDVTYLLKTNITGYLACCKEAIPRMQKQNAGNILLIGSMSAVTKEADSSLYVATKAAIQGFSEAFRKEVNDMNIHVSLLTW
ncbi:MAG: SDR family NAD(P)-dependent oxidoreductase [Pedobacter sp.]|nr:MAG: SDR family NAD(P)-dependent oxidoreductase [Pedobacter sp.]